MSCQSISPLAAAPSAPTTPMEIFAVALLGFELAMLTKSNTAAEVQAPNGTDVRAGCSGRPSHFPCNIDLKAAGLGTVSRAPATPLPNLSVTASKRYFFYGSDQPLHTDLQQAPVWLNGSDRRSRRGLPRALAVASAHWRSDYLPINSAG